MSKRKPLKYKHVLPKPKPVNQILVVDVAANCWRKADDKPPTAKHEIIEIGIVPINLETLELGQAESILVKPKTAKISQFCTQMTSITQEMVDGGVSFKKAIKKMTDDFKSNERLWVSWTEYDRFMIRQDCNERKASYPFNGSAGHWNLSSLFTVMMGLDKPVRLREAIKLAGLGQFVGTPGRAVDSAINMSSLAVEMFSRIREPRTVVKKPMTAAVNWTGLAAMFQVSEEQVGSLPLKAVI